MKRLILKSFGMRPTESQIPSAARLNILPQSSSNCLRIQNLMKKIALLLTITLSVVANLKANIVLNEQFTYPDGPLVGAVGSPWQAHSGAGSNPVLVTNKEIRVAHGSGTREDVNAALAGAPYPVAGGASLYASFQVRFTALPGTNGDYFAHFRDAGTGFRCRIWASATNAEPGRFRLSVGNTSSDNPSLGQFPRDLDTGAVYQVVTRLEVGTGVSTLWVNPASEADTSVQPLQTTGPIDISTYAFRQGSGPGGACWVSNLKVGTSFNDVAGANNPPTITAIADQHLSMGGTAGPLPFSVSDSETASSSLVVTKQSSNPGLLPEENIVIEGADANRTVTINSAAGQQGTADVTLTVSDGDGSSTSTGFKIFVGYPTISAISSHIIVSNTSTGPIPITVGDAETPAENLTLSATSFNANLIPVENVVFGGSGATRTVTITPVAGLNGYSTISVTVSDGSLTASNSFTVTVKPLLGVLIDEPFNYPDDTLIADGTTPWVNHSGTFGQTKVFGGKLSLINTNTEDFNREFFPLYFPSTNGVVLYASFKARFSQTPSASGNYFAHYKDDTTAGFRCKHFASSLNAPAGSLRFGITYNVSSINSNLLHPRFIQTNTEHTVVSRYDIGTGACTMWIDPINENDPSVSSVDTTSAITVYSFAFRQDSGMGTFTVDDLKIGTAFTDVAEPRYSLSIIRTGPDTLEVSWPLAAGDAGYVLQSKGTVSEAWELHSDQGTTQGSRKAVTLSHPTSSRFFQLAK